MSTSEGEPSAVDLREELTLAAALTAEGFSAPDNQPGEQALAAASELARAADRTLHLFVRQEREAGTSWAGIGSLLGITRQAAQKRFSTPPPRHDAPRAQASDDQLRRAIEVLDHAAAGRSEPIQELLGHGLRAALGEEGIAPAIAGIAPVFGRFEERVEVSARVLARVTVVIARERWSVMDAEARVTLAPDGSLMGLFYKPAGEG